jgi:hypothetical protein
VHAAPQSGGRAQRIEMLSAPPGGLIAAVVDFAMMGAAERHGKFVADLTPQRAELSKAEVMGVGGLASADQAWLPRDELQVLLVSDAARFRKSQDRG